MTKELVFDHASTWFVALRIDEVLVRVKPGLLERFSWLPLAELQKDAPADFAMAFSHCVVGAMTFLWHAVMYGVEAVMRLGRWPCAAFPRRRMASQPYRAFPQADEPMRRWPMRRARAGDKEGAPIDADHPWDPPRVHPVVVPGAQHCNLGSRAPEYAVPLAKTRLSRVAAFNSGLASDKER